MPQNIRAHRVFIASPGGLEDVRKQFCQTLRDWNHEHSLERGFSFHPIGWEDTLPGMGRPQSLINKDLSKCDYLVLVLWDRWGTPPGGDDEWTSGTEEEFELARAAIPNAQQSMREIVVLFKGLDARRQTDPGPQLRKVLEFKKKLEDERSLLYGTFDTVGEFEVALLKQLRRWASAPGEEEGDKPHPPAGGPIPSAQPNQTQSVSIELDRLSHSPELEDIIRKGLSLADQGKTVEAETEFSRAILSKPSVETLLAYAKFLHRVGRLQQAEVMCVEAQKIATRSGDQSGLAYVSMIRGNLLVSRGDLEIAEAMYRTALEVYERLKQPEGIATTFGNLGIVLQLRGDLDGAEAMHRQALEIEERLGRSEGIACDYGSLGNVLKTRGDLDGAEAMYRKALEIDERLGRSEGMANSYGNLGVVLQMRGDLDGAEVMHRRALEIDERLGRLEGIASSCGNLGKIQKTRKDFDGANELWCRARDIFQQLGAKHMVDKVKLSIDSLPKQP